ncbi:MAG: septum formation protein Maf [Caldisericia bacterium]|nr:septum formation protein Maf [Caldisericia bacterium]
MDIILASCSERRKYICSKIFNEFKSINSNTTEISLKNKNPNQAIRISLANAQKKSESIALITPNHSLIIGCDTVIVSKKAILGKPSDMDEAVEMLSDLSGTTHEAITYVSIIETCNFEIIQKLYFYDLTKITFRFLPQSAITNYVSIFKPTDKAGAYGIQEVPKEFIKEISGSFWNVMGFPVEKFFSLADKSWNKYFKEPYYDFNIIDRR